MIAERRVLFGQPAAAILLSLAMVGCATIGRSGGDAANGHVVAEQWCSECHHVSPQDPTGSRAGHILPPTQPGPDFAEIAHRPYADDAYLARFTGELHLPMPIYRLSETERQDIVAYIRSLK